MKRSLSIGVRLTAWYTVCMALALCGLGILAFLSMRHSIHSTVDEQLRDRMNVVQETVSRSLGRGTTDILRQELDEDSELRPQSDLLQIWDDQGNLLYQSAPLKANALPPAGTVSQRGHTIWIGEKPIRVLETSVTVHGHLYHIQAGAQMEEFYEALGRFRGRLLTLTPVALLLASALGYWMSRRALAPVDDITQAANEISAYNLSARLTVPHSGDELQRLAETLNQMLQRIEAALDRVTRFSADASHELRTPITVMRTRAEIALRRPRTAVEDRQTLEQLYSELVRTSELLDSLMLLARADFGAEQLRLAPANLDETLKDVVAQVAPIADGKGVSLYAELPCHAVWIAGDIQLLRRLFLILIENAVKYTPASGHVSVALGAEDGMAVVRVTDTGIGIAQNDLSHIFDRFYRGDKARSRELGGAGLGLSIGRWIAEAHGGSIDVESRTGAGSTFAVILPTLADRALGIGTAVG
jgi:heavy metal sensor kinase